MKVPARRNGTFFNVAQFFVINLVIIFVCLRYVPVQARKIPPLMIEDDGFKRMNRPGELHILDNPKLNIFFLKK